MQGKKWIAAALVCGFLLGQGTAPAQAGILGTVVKGGAVSLLVSQFADQLNSAINTLTAISYFQRLRYQGSADHYRG